MDSLPEQMHSIDPQLPQDTYQICTLLCLPNTCLLIGWQSQASEIDMEQLEVTLRQGGRCRGGHNFSWLRQRVHY